MRRQTFARIVLGVILLGAFITLAVVEPLFLLGIGIALALCVAMTTLLTWAIDP